MLVAHHDARADRPAVSPGLIPAVNRIAPRMYERQKTSTQTGRLMVAGPALVPSVRCSGGVRCAAAGVLWSAVTAALLLDVERSAVVPGANDNLSAVAVLLALAGELAE